MSTVPPGWKTSGRWAMWCAGPCSRTRARRRESRWPTASPASTRYAELRADSVGHLYRARNCLGGEKPRRRRRRRGLTARPGCSLRRQWPPPRPWSQPPVFVKLIANRGHGRNTRRAYHRTVGRGTDRRAVAGHGIPGQCRGPAAHHPRPSHARRSVARSGARRRQARDRQHQTASWTATQAARSARSTLGTVRRRLSTRRSCSMSRTCGAHHDRGNAIRRVGVGVDALDAQAAPVRRRPKRRATARADRRLPRGSATGMS